MNEDTEYYDECEHNWVYYGASEDGTLFFKCSICQEERES